MKNIKIVGIIIPLIAIILVALSYFKSEYNLLNRDSLESINIQKAFTQEISKNIFYIYKNRDSSTKNLDNLIKKFLSNQNNKLTKSKEVIKLWNKFYKDIEQFKTHIYEDNMYSNILKRVLVKEIYDTNLELIALFDKKIKKAKTTYHVKTNSYTYLEYFLYTILVLLLIYLFTKLQEIFGFIQKFVSTSKNILKNSSIKGLKPIKVSDSDRGLHEASKNYNFLVKKINKSIKSSSTSLSYSHKSLSLVETNIENLMELINTMDESNRDKNFSQKEDAVIESLEEIISASKKLENLQKDLDELIDE